jgi:peptidoglycan L-alanyl-D-glutamate endopeptidase CwlK
MAFTLSPTDTAKLKQVDPRLMRLTAAVSGDAACPPFTVFEGLRTLERQKKLFATGKSKTLNSNHLTGRAVDLVPLNAKNEPVWSIEGCNRIAAVVFKHAEQLGIKIRWGGDWDQDKEWRDERFYDGPHFELSKAEPVRPLSNHASTILPDDIPTLRKTVNVPIKNAEWNTAHAQKVAIINETLRALIKISDRDYIKYLLPPNEKASSLKLRATVRAVQRYYGLEQDGLWGPATHKASAAAREASL